MVMIKAIANGTEINAVPGASIMEACLGAGIHIPHLCHDPRVGSTGCCRLCTVRVKDIKGLVISCITPLKDGMHITTEDPQIADQRRGVLELILSDHRADCTDCDRCGNCRLQTYAYQYRVAADKFARPVQSGHIKNYTANHPGIQYMEDRCIKCGLCVKYCSEIQMADALTFACRNERMRVTTAFNEDLHKTSCEGCGGCIRVCPAGAMLDRQAVGWGRDIDLKKIATICPYCGVGCQLDLFVDKAKNRIIRSGSDPTATVNGGNLCVKGHFAFDFVYSPERLKTPLIKENGAFREASWDEALILVGRRLREIRDRHGPAGIAFMSSCRCTNEENYLMQKLARMAGKTNNIDQCATTCHAPTVAGLAAAFGSGAMTNSIAEIRNVQTLFLIGANPTDAHPIVGLAMKKALRRGARLMVCDPRETWMARQAHIHIKHKPGTDNMLINAMMNHIIARGLQNKKFVEERCENFESLCENVRSYSIATAAETCGVDADLIRRAAEWYAAGTPSAIFYTLGITEHTCGTENVQNLANLAMLCGQIGKESSGVNPLRGQNNVQGGCDMGAMPYALPGYQKISDPEVRRKFEQAWGGALPTNSGGRVTDFIEKAGEGVLKALYLIGEDPARSEANSTQVIRNLQKIEFIVCQDIFMSETAKLAQVVLPAACFAEKDGTFTNTERRVQRVRKAVEPPGEARPDWQIICEVSSAMGYRMAYHHPGEIWAELAALTPSLAGISYERIDKVGLQWPCPTKEHPGTRFLHKDRFTRGKGLFHVIKFRPPAEEPDDEFPMILSTGRTLFNYNIGNMTRKTGMVEQKEPENFVEMHVDDAARLGIRDGDNVRVRTRRGAIVVRARVAGKVRPGALWMPFHHAEASANLLTNDAFDSVTRTPEYKCCAARIESVSK